MKTNTTNWDYRPYNGHPNWQLWNVSLWISGDEHFYYYVMGLLEEHGFEEALDILSEQLQGQATPDGAQYSRYAIRYALCRLIEP